MSDSRLLALLNLAMADTAFTIWRAKRDFGGDPNEVTWRPWTAILLADTDGIGAPCRIRRGGRWSRRRAIPSIPPATRQNGAAATVLLSHFADAQRFTLTTRIVVMGVPVDLEPHLREHLAGTRRRQRRARLGWNALPEHRSDQRRRGRGDRRVR